MADTLGTVTGKVRALLNDPDVQEYSDSVLVPYVGMAQSQLDSYLRSKGIERYRLEANVTVPAGTTVLTLTTTPALPADLVQPIVLHERLSGSTRADDWRGMVQIREDLPNVIQSERLGFWSWQGGAIRFVGATTDRQIQIDYLNVPAEVALPADVLPMLDSAEALAYLTASLVCTSKGADQAAAAFYAGPTPGVKAGGYLLARENLYATAMRQKQRRVLRRKFYYPSRSSRLPYIT